MSCRDRLGLVMTANQDRRAAIVRHAKTIVLATRVSNVSKMLREERSCSFRFRSPFRTARISKRTAECKIIRVFNAELVGDGTNQQPSPARR